MNIRVYGIKGKKGRYEEIILSREEQKTWYRDCCYRIMNNTRWILDNLEYLPEFRVNWNHYPHSQSKKRKTYK